MIGRLLEINGMALRDVELVPLGKIGAMMAALQGKQVDAVVLNEPNITKAVNAGFGQVIQSVGDAMPYQTSAIFYAPNFTKDKDRAVKFMRAYIKSVRYYEEAVLRKEKGKNYDEVIGIITKYTNMPAEDVKKGIPYIDKDGKLLASDIDTQIQWYAEKGLIDKPIKRSAVVDMSFWEAAVKGK